MNAKDLMVGDWVECTYWTPSKQLKVAEIRRIMDDETKIGVYFDDLVLIFRQSEVKPIPLMPEILEKNGWRYDKSACTWVNDDIEIHLEDGFDGNGFWWKAGVNHITPINYVHELQHALRLCRIEKTIVL